MDSGWWSQVHRPKRKLPVRLIVLGIGGHWLLGLRQETAGDDAYDGRRGNDCGVLFCWQLAADVPYLHRVDRRRLSADETRLLNALRAEVGRDSNCRARARLRAEHQPQHV